MEDVAERHHRAVDDQVYRVTLSPLERGARQKLGVDGRLKAIVFEREDGGWIGSAPIHRTRTLWELTREEPERCLEPAVVWVSIPLGRPPLHPR